MSAGAQSRGCKRNRDQLDDAHPLQQMHRAAEAPPASSSTSVHLPLSSRLAGLAAASAGGAGGAGEGQAGAEGQTIRGNFDLRRGMRLNFRYSAGSRSGQYRSVTFLCVKKAGLLQVWDQYVAGVRYYKFAKMSDLRIVIFLKVRC